MRGTRRLGWAVFGFAFLTLAVTRSRGQTADDEEPTKLPDLLKASASSSVELHRYSDGTQIPHTRNVSFYVQVVAKEREVGKKREVSTLLLKEQIDVEESPAWKGEGWEQAEVQLTAETIQPDGRRRPRYRIVERGQRGLLFGPWYAVASFGCCDTGTGYALYSLESGRLVMYASGGEAPGNVRSFEDTSVKPYRQRWIGVHTSHSRFGKEVYGEHGNAPRAMVTYASEAGPLTQVLLQFGPDDPHANARYIFVQRLEVPEGKPSAPQVRIDFEAAGVVEIPIRGGALDVAHAHLPPGVTAVVQTGKATTPTR
jgi:hypothetical protein